MLRKLAHLKKNKIKDFWPYCKAKCYMLKIPWLRRPQPVSNLLITIFGCYQLIPAWDLLVNLIYLPRPLSFTSYLGYCPYSAFFLVIIIPISSAFFGTNTNLSTWIGQKWTSRSRKKRKTGRLQGGLCCWWKTLWRPQNIPLSPL